MRIKTLLHLKHLVNAKIDIAKTSLLKLQKADTAKASLNFEKKIRILVLDKLLKNLPN